MSMESIQSLQWIVADLEKFIAKALVSPFPFALWRKPNGNYFNLLIDITPEKSIDKDWSLENLTECFVINSYAASHPTQPEILKGDLIITIAPDQTEIKVNPRISATAIERFLEKIETIDHSYFDSKASANVSDEASYYQNIVAHAVSEIKREQLQKVVLARKKEVALPTDLKPYALFEQLTAKYPNAFCYFISSTINGNWMGATPERLITIENQQTFTTDALAGTQPLAEGHSLADIAWTQKEIEEQAMVCRYIIECFKKIRLREYEEIGPKTVQAGNLAHLKTSFTVDMNATNSPMLGSTMLELLHPTSAVCGFPREAANQFICENEGFERSLFSGFLGPVNFKNHTRLFVNLRCMKLEPNKATLYAGAGITADSNPVKEFAETEHKMNTLLSVLWPQ
jgi:isochorismate synthase